MKRFFYHIIILTIAITTLCKCTGHTDVSDKNAIITFKEIRHDFGTITEGDNGSYEFVYVNTGKVPLILKQVVTSCGCTVSKWSKKPTEPNGTGKIKVTYNTNILGSFTKSINVYSNAYISPVVLKIKGVVKAKPIAEGKASAAAAVAAKK